MGKRIFIVEDERDIRDCLALALESEGYETITAEQGQQALEKLGTMGARPDLILLDLMMPVMDGWTFHAELKKHPEWSSIPVVVISAMAERARGLSPQGLIRKPIELDTLFDTVAREVAVS